MRIEDIEKYLCVNCGGRFTEVEKTLLDNNDGAVLEGMLVCNSCKEKHPIVNRIPRFVPIDNYAKSFGYQWNLHRRTQLDSYTGMPISRDRLFAVSGWPEHMEGEYILEAGSGAGRFTEVLLQTGAEVFSFDYSNAVEANLGNNGETPNLHLFQGDIFAVPFSPAYFDRVLCLGVLQHIQNPEMAFKALVNFVKPGGDIVIDIYRNNFVSVLHWKYLLRPITKHIEKELLYEFVEKTVDICLRPSIYLQKIGGRFGARLLPILQHSQLGLPFNLTRQWAILDTFDMYSPVHDHPQSLSTVTRWFVEAGLEDITVKYGPNGIVGRGRRPTRQISQDKSGWCHDYSSRI